MTAQRLYLTWYPMYLCNQTHLIDDITPYVCMKSHPLPVWQHRHFIWHHIHSCWQHTIDCVSWPKFCLCDHMYYICDLTSHPVYLSSRPLYLCNHTQYIYDITATLCMISHTVYMWHPIHYIYDIISRMYDNTTLCVDTTLGICVTSFALQMISHPLYHTKPQYLWCHIHFRHDITPTVSDIAPTVSLSSQPLHWYHAHFCMTSYPLYVWHHMHSI